MDRYAACLDCGSHLYHRRDCELAKGLRESAAGGTTYLGSFQRYAEGGES